jgi:hypothetical protein
MRREIYMTRPLVILLILACSFITLSATRAFSLLSLSSSIECGDLGFQNLNPLAGSINCDVRQFLYGKYFSAHLKKNSSDLPLEVSFRDPTHKYNMTSQSIGTSPGLLVMNDKDQKRRWESKSILTRWSAMVREHVPFLENEPSVTLALNSESEFELILTTNAQKNLLSKNIEHLTLVIAACVILLFSGPLKNNWMQYALLSTILAIVILWCGLPFCSAAGWFDPGDDLSYLHWTYAIGYLFDPDLTHSSFIPSWSLNHNHHPWGTGLLLAPFLIPARLMGLGMKPNMIHYSLMNFGVVFSGCLAVGILFRSFRLFSHWRPALVIAVLSLISTSMLKWMFIRNFFSHVPEFVTLSSAAYFALLRFYSLRVSRRCFFAMLISILLATQVRRENLALFGLLLSFEWLHLDMRSLKEKLRDSGFILLFSGLSIVILSATNYFTLLKSFSGNPLVQRDFHSDNLVAFFIKQAPEVFFRESFGLFYWKNAYSWLALFSCILERKSWRWWLPLASTTLFYLLMCTFFEYPNGFEWQNRFLLKLNPVLFAGTLIFLTRAPPLLKIIAWCWTIYGAWAEVNLYFTQIPSIVDFYSTNFSDQTFKFPQSLPPAVTILFYLPLLVIWMVSFLLWIKVYLIAAKTKFYESH